MSNQWLRLWHDMPNDPKWRTIARISGQPISLVLSVYLHLMVDASRNVTRGHADVTVEDMSSALDATEEQIGQIYCAMQGRVMEGNRLTGWEKRQPKREDSGCGESGAKSAAERKRDQRWREKEAQYEKEKPQCHAMSRDVTLDKDKDKDKEEDKSKEIRKNKQRGSRLPADWSPSSADVMFCKTERPDLDAGRTADRFRDYWHAQPGAKGSKLDWSATWRNWVRNESHSNRQSNQAMQDERLRIAREITEASKNERRYEIDISSSSYVVDGQALHEDGHNVRPWLE